MFLKISFYTSVYLLINIIYALPVEVSVKELPKYAKIIKISKKNLYLNIKNIKSSLKIKDKLYIVYKKKNIIKALAIIKITKIKGNKAKAKMIENLSNLKVSKFKKKRAYTLTNTKQKNNNTKDETQKDNDINSNLIVKNNKFKLNIKKNAVLEKITKIKNQNIYFKIKDFTPSVFVNEIFFVLEDKKSSKVLAEIEVKKFIKKRKYALSNVISTFLDIDIKDLKSKFVVRQSDVKIVRDKFEDFLQKKTNPNDILNIKMGYSHIPYLSYAVIHSKQEQKKLQSSFGADIEMFFPFMSNLQILNYFGLGFSYKISLTKLQKLLYSNDFPESNQMSFYLFIKPLLYSKIIHSISFKIGVFDLYYEDTPSRKNINHSSTLARIGQSLDIEIETWIWEYIFAGFNGNFSILNEFSFFSKETRSTNSIKGNWNYYGGNFWLRFLWPINIKNSIFHIDFKLGIQGQIDNISWNENLIKTPLEKLAIWFFSNLSFSYKY